MPDRVRQVPSDLDRRLGSLALGQVGLRGAPEQRKPGGSFQQAPAPGWSSLLRQQAANLAEADLDAAPEFGRRRGRVGAAEAEDGRLDVLGIWHVLRLHLKRGECSAPSRFGPGTLTKGRAPSAPPTRARGTRGARP